MSRFNFKHLPRFFTLLLAGLAALCLLGAGGFLLLLRTAWAEEYAFSLFTRLLAEQGYTLTFKEFSGPLTLHMRAVGLTFADKDGPIARASGLTADISLAALLRGDVELDMRLEKPELLRLPKGGKGGRKSGGGAPFALNLPALALPVPIRLHSLRLEDGRLPVSVFPALAQTKPPEALGPLPDSLAVDAEATAVIVDGELESSLILSLDAGTGRKLRLKADARAKGKAASLSADGALDLPLKAPGEAERRDFVFNYDLEAGIEGSQVRLSRLNLAGLGAALALEGTLNLEAATAEARLTLKAKDEESWQAFLAALPVTAKNNAAVEPAPAKEFAFSADVALAGVPVPGKKEAGPPGARLSFAANGLDVLGIGVSGGMKGRIEAAGGPDSLSLTADISAPEIAIAETALRGLAVNLNANGKKSPDGKLALDGMLNASVSGSPGGSATLKTAWQAGLYADGSPERLNLSGLRAGALGALLNGDVTAFFTAGGASPIPEIDGELKLEVTDWSGASALGGIALNGSPALAVLRLERAPHGQNARLALNADSLAVKDASVQALDIDLAATDLWNKPSLKGTLGVASGNAGPVAWGDAKAVLDGGQDGEFSLELRGGQIPGLTNSPMPREADSPPPAKTAPPQAKKGATAPQKSGQGAKNPPRSGAGGYAALSLAGAYDLKRSEVTLSSLVFNIPERKAGVRLLAPLRLSYAQGLRLSGLKAALAPDGALTGDLDWRKSGGLVLNAALKNLPTEFFRLFSDAEIPPGLLDASLDYAEAASGPKGAISLNARLGLPKGASARLGGDPGLAIKLDASLARRNGALALTGAGGAEVLNAGRIDPGKFAFSLPMRLSGGLPLPDPAGPLSASFAWAGRVAPLWRFAPLPGRSLDGAFSVELTLGGNLAAPSVAGSAYLAGGRYEDKPMGLLFTNMALEAHGSPDAGLRFVFAAGDGHDGSLAAEGALTLGAGGPKIDARGQIRHLRPLHRDDLSMTLSGLVSANGSLSAPELAADLIVEQGELTLLSTLGAGAGPRTLDIADAAAKPAEAAQGPVCRMHVDVPGRFFIRGRGLDSEWKGRLNVAGPLGRPSLTGSLSPVRGTFELLSKTFVFSNGAISFDGGDRINPGINLELEYAGPDLTAVAVAGGSAQKPSLSLTSRPPLAQDEVLARVLFGKNVAELSRVEVLQLANSMRELAGVGEGGFSPMATARKALGLDVLRMGGGDTRNERTDSGMSGAADAPGVPRSQSSAGTAPDSGTPSLEAGKYINDSIYVGVEQGATQESTGVRVEIELAPHLNLQGKTTPSSSRVGLGWKKDY